MDIRIPEYVGVLMERLVAAGEECYVVGGGLRDTLLGNAPNDYDLTTSATPEKMCENEVAIPVPSTSGTTCVGFIEAFSNASTSPL